MSQRIRLGNVYQHDKHGKILTTHRDQTNQVWYRKVVGRDNAGVVSTDEEIYREGYRDLLGNVSMLDYPDNWNDIAEAIRKRDNNQCQSCGNGERQLHVHHIVPLGAGGSNARSNLLTLCEECHGKVHGGVT
jgi:predicted HNH restriction endonuclease